MLVHPIAAHTRAHVHGKLRDVSPAHTQLQPDASPRVQGRDPEGAHVSTQDEEGGAGGGQRVQQATLCMHIGERDGGRRGGGEKEVKREGDSVRGMGQHTLTCGNSTRKDVRATLVQRPNPDAKKNTTTTETKELIRD